MKAEGEAALEVARTQQEADKATADIKKAAVDILRAEGFKPPPKPVPEPINTDAVYFKVLTQRPGLLSPSPFQLGQAPGFS